MGVLFSARPNDPLNGHFRYSLLNNWKNDPSRSFSAQRGYAPFSSGTYSQMEKSVKTIPKLSEESSGFGYSEPITSL